MKRKPALALMSLLMKGAFGFALTACQLPEVSLDASPAVTPAVMLSAVPPLADAVQLPGIHTQMLPLDSLRYTISIPENYNGKQPVPLVLALHYGGLVTPYYGKGVLVELFEPAFRELGAIIVAPDSAAGDWANPRSEANVLALLDTIQATYNIDQRRSLITGYSMGGMGVWYLAARHQDRFTAALPVSGRPQDDSADVSWQIPLYVIHSQDDELIPMAETMQTVSQLAEKGVDIQLVVVKGITHFETYRFVESLQAAIPWIQAVWQ